MKEQYKGLFAFSSSQRKGVVILLSLIGAVIFARIWYHSAYPQDNSRITFQLPANLHETLEAKEARSKKFSYAKPNKSWKLESKDLTPFDPNEVGIPALINMGFSEKMARSFINFRSAIGGYKRLSQIEKLYGLSAENFAIIAPYVLLKQPPSSPVKEHVQVNINTADSSEFVRLHGIGPVYAKRIVRYRSKLRGFVSVDQLAEVYGVEDSLLAKLKPHVFLTGGPETRNINSLSVTEIKKLPYVVSYNQARAIFNYRKQHGDYSQIEDLLKVKLVDTSMVRRLTPYLKFEK